MLTQRPEWRPASKTQTHIQIHTQTAISLNYIMWKRSTIKCLTSLLFLSESLDPSIITLLLHSSSIFLSSLWPPFSIFFPSSLHLCSFSVHLCLCFLLLCCTPQGLLGFEEPLSSRGRRSLQLAGVVISEDPSVLPEELRQRGLTSPEWPFLIFLSGEPQVISAQQNSSIVSFRCLGLLLH